MKKIITLFTLFFLFLTNAQNVQGKITYHQQHFFGKNLKEKENDTKDIESNEIKKALYEQLKKGQSRYFVLDFDGFSSFYAQEEKLETDKPDNSGGIKISISRDKDNAKRYKNIKDKWYVNEDDVFSKKVIVKDSLKAIDWQITSETKTIGNYQCVKAVFLIKVTDQLKKKYEEELNKQSQKKVNLFPVKEPKDREIIAWFTPEIPIGHGPEDFYGLPGIILELHDEVEKVSYHAIKIELNPSKKINIKLPKLNKTMTQEAFDDFKEKKANELKNEDGMIIFEH